MNPSPRNFFIQSIGITFYLLLCPYPALAVDTSQHSKDFYISAAESNVKQGKFFQALENYQTAIDSWGRSPDMKQQMSVLYYHLGFLDEAIATMKDALNSAPDNDYLNHRLGVLYFAVNDLIKARKQFIKALKINPGSADSHYYLAHVLLHQGFSDVAEMFAYSAQQLGHPATDILELFADRSQPLPATVWLTDKSKIYLRQISVKERKHSEAIMARLKAGDLFENIARLESRSLNGGYSGGYSVADLQPRIVSSLSDKIVPSPPIVVESDNSFTVVQKIAPIDWQLIAPMYDLPHSKATQAAPLKTGSLSANGMANNDFFYSIQLGAFRENKYARQKIKKINTLGYEGYLIEILSGGQPLYMVYAGKFPSRSAARIESLKLLGMGFEVFIVKRKGAI